MLLLFNTTATADDDINNEKLHPKRENSIGDLDGIQQYLTAEYNNLDGYVNDYNSTTDKTKLMIFDTYRVNNSIRNEADVRNDSVLDDNDKYCMIYDRTDDANPSSLPPKSSMPCIHSMIGEVNKKFHFWTNIPNGEPYDNNDNMYNDTVPNQANGNNYAIILDEYNTISPIKREVNKNYLFWKTGSNNNHNQDLEICYDDHYRVRSELVGCNPSKIPDDGERIVLLVRYPKM